MTTAEIGSVVDAVPKWDPRKEGSGPFTYVDLSSVDQTLKEITEPATVKAKEAPSRARQLIAAGDVLVSTVRPNLNAVAFVSPELDGATSSTGFCVLRPRSGEVNGRYLYHWVRSPSFIAQMIRLSTGASYPAVSDKIVKTSRIPLPPIEEQRRIATILDSADALRVKRHQALAKLNALTRAIFVDMFGDPYDGSGSWMPLSELVRAGDKINYGVVQPGDDVIDGVPLIRVGDLVDGRVDHTSIKLIAPEIDKKYRRSKLMGDEVLVSCVGSAGAVALASKDEAGWNIARAVARVPLSEDVRREYVAAFLASPIVQRYFENELRTVSQPTLNIKQIKETPVRVPERSRQDEFVYRLQCLNAELDKYRSQALRLGALFASIQQRAFRGQL